MEINNFLHDLLRHKFLSQKPINKEVYTGRGGRLHADKLNELWIHTNNSCNLTCSHCLVDSGPGEDEGLPAETVKKIIDEAIALGTHRFYFTGGEPLQRKNIFELIDYICNEKGAELILLTNGTLLKGNVLRQLQRYDKKRLMIQISLDGSQPEINDPIRGKGNFTHIIDGIKNSISMGFSPTITTVITKQNVHDIPDITKLIAQSGGKTHHLLWAHKRGRITQNGADSFAPIHDLLETIKRAKIVAEDLGVFIDNLDAYTFRANSNKGTRYDLGNAWL